MKTRTPLSNNDLKIKKSYKVLEIGPGHNPRRRSDVLLEKFIDTNYHRCGDVKVYPHQVFYHGVNPHYPFKDKEFDYVYCSNVLEHVDDPVEFLAELSRVAKRGYIETPSITGELLFPKESHKWCIMDMDGKLVLFEKAKMRGNFGNDYGEAMLNYLPYQSLPFRILHMSEPQFSFVRFEWKDSVECIVNPEDEKYRRFFTQKWTREMCEQYFPPRSLGKELCRVHRAFWLMVKEKIQARLHKDKPVPLSEYVKTHEVIEA